MPELVPLLLADREYFEHLAARRETPGYHDDLRALLPAGWLVREEGIWLHCSPVPPPSLPPQGFKIHVSGTTRDAIELLGRVVRVCTSAHVRFKSARDQFILNYLNSKHCGRGSAGKFITIYPVDTETFKSLIPAVWEAVRGFRGPYILSDRRYGDSENVFYRFGGFQPRNRVNLDGTHTPVISLPDGMIEDDNRLPFYRLPPGVGDPFGDEDGVQRADEVLLNERYRVKSALSFSNTGGVYLADDTVSGSLVVVKEARPLTNCIVRDDSFYDAVSLLQREFAFLRKLQGLSCVPAAVELFQQWEHTFLVEEYAEGVPVAQMGAKAGLSFLESLEHSSRLERFWTVFRRLGLGLIDAIGSIHSRGIVIGDVSPNNIILDLETFQVAIVDLETATAGGEPDILSRHARALATPGFRKGGAIAPGDASCETDYYAAGMVLFSLLAPVQALFDLNPDAGALILGRLEGLGTPPCASKAITNLCSGDAPAALRALVEWEADVADEGSVRS